MKGDLLDIFQQDELPTAEFSPCRTYRYKLRRRWGPGHTVAFILLNPSTADETHDDPTIRRCIEFAKAWGAGGLVLGNIFAFRATNPMVMRSFPDPVGPGNDQALSEIVDEASHGRIICGWGTHGAHRDRGHQVLAMLRGRKVKPMALSMTLMGQPGHPLYLRGSTIPFEVPT